MVQTDAVYGYGSTVVIGKNIQSACQKEEEDFVVAYSQNKPSSV